MLLGFLDDIMLLNERAMPITPECVQSLDPSLFVLRPYSMMVL